MSDIGALIDEGKAAKLDVYKYVASKLSNTPYEQVTQEQRGAAKILCYEYIYNG